jgi:hypothetical protein
MVPTGQEFQIGGPVALPYVHADIHQISYAPGSSSPYCNWM